MRKTALLGLVAIIGLTSTGLKVGSLYTESKVSELAKNLSLYTDDEILSQGELSPIDLNSLLCSNIYTQGSESAGAGTSEEYQKGWRDIAAKNSVLLHLGIKTYGKTFIQKYKENILNKQKLLLSKNAEWRKVKSFQEYTIYMLYEDSTVKQEKYNNYLKNFKKDSLRYEKNISSFSIDKYWKNQKIFIAKYDSLIKKLLTLDDKRLNEYIRSVRMGNTVTIKFQTWLYLQKLNTTPNPTYFNLTWEPMYYPLDFLDLTYRITRDYPKQWKTRSFLIEAGKLSNEIKEVIPK